MAKLEFSSSLCHPDSERSPEVSYISNTDFSYCEEISLILTAIKAHYMVVYGASLQYVIVYEEHKICDKRSSGQEEGTVQTLRTGGVMTFLL